MNPHNFLNFFFELGHLRQIKHEGWRLAGVQYPESVADHSLRAAQIGYFLALSENYPKPDKIVTMLAFHDMAECRIGDLHKVANGYVTSDEKRAVDDQLKPLGKDGERLNTLWNEVEDSSTPAGVIAKDADYLEQAVTGKEYLEQGHPIAQNWIDNVKKALKTKTAKELVAELEKARSTDWWQHLKKL